MTHLRFYPVYGGYLASEMEIPELAEAPVSTPDWTLRVLHGDGEVMEPGGTVVGRDELEGEVVVALERSAAGFRLTYSDTGTFAVTIDGREMAWYERAGADPQLVRLDVLNLVFATALYTQGALALHASSVEVRGQALAFVAPKFSGKSTLALALTYAGGRLLTDDTLAIEPGAPPLCRPGVHAVRLRGDAAQYLLRGEAGDAGFNVRHDRVIPTLSTMNLSREPVPLGALYLLNPRDPKASEPLVHRTVVDPTTAAMAILGQLKLGRLLEKTGELLGPALDIARRVPVYSLGIGRDMSRIDEAAAIILAWHSG
jgi:hypothetical protein